MSKPITRSEAAKAHDVIGDAIRVIAHYARMKQDRGNVSQHDALVLKMANMAAQLGPLRNHAMMGKEVLA